MKEMAQGNVAKKGLPQALQHNAAEARVRCLNNPQSYHRHNRRTDRLTGLQYSLA